MKKATNLFILLALFLTSCGEDESHIINDFSVENFSASVLENPVSGYSIGFIDGTFGDSTIFNLTTISHSNAFRINSSTGELYILNSEIFDFEINTLITGTVEVIFEGITKNALIEINVIDINETVIEVSDFEILLDHLPTANESLGVLEATSNSGSVSFNILGQRPENAIRIDSNSGEIISNNDIIDFNGNPIIRATIRVESNGYFMNAEVTVKVVFPCNTTPELVAYYPLNGNANDVSGFNNNGQINGPLLTQDRFLNDDSAYYFDGNDDDITVADNDQLFLGDEFTLSAWVFPEQIKTQHIIRKGRQVNGAEAWPFGLDLSGSNEVVFSVTANLYQARKLGYNRNEWILVTGVLKNQIMYLYVNGDLVAYEPIEGTIVNDDLPLLIGTRLNTPANTFRGKIDDVRIYNGALCEAQILDIYTN